MLVSEKIQEIEQVIKMSSTVIQDYLLHNHLQLVLKPHSQDG